FVTKYKVEQKSFHLFLTSFILCSPTILLYFILSTIAVKDVPEWNEWIAFFYWSVCHLLYIWLLPVLYKNIGIKAERP
ncbi:MAG: hypothetical protein R3250_08805, partial [Melioribacteraceae bacterium]|nr:hypothetical protein [Melioribacteraceae bacterium]